MNRAWELCIKFFLLLIFAPVLLFYAIHLIAALLQVIASFVVAVLPVLIVATLALGIPVVLFIMLSQRWRQNVSHRGNGHSGTSLLGNAAIRRPRGKKGHDDDD